MKVHFWGVRGSTPVPLAPHQIRDKIADVLRLASPQDVASPEAAMQFLAALPDGLCGTVGGNTACVELTGSDGACIILDAGSGLRGLGNSGVRPDGGRCCLFLSHFHWDHIQGLPFFKPIYDGSLRIDIFSARADARNELQKQQSQPFFPTEFDAAGRIQFHTVPVGRPFQLGPLRVDACKMQHPGSVHAFAFTEDGRKLVYATDIELSEQDAPADAEQAAVFQNADCILIDSQYTAEDALRHRHWGHSSFKQAVDFAARWNIRRMFLFHYEPTYDDKKLASILEEARLYAARVAPDRLEVDLAVEGQEFEL